MSFEYNPADEDEHALCRHEIESLRAENAALRDELARLREELAKSRIPEPQEPSE